MPFSTESIFGQPWYDWWITNGTKGEESPEPVKQQFSLYNQIEQTPDPDEQATLVKQLLDIAAEQFWCIGTTRYYQSYRVVKMTFRNLPRSGVWSWHICSSPAQTMPEQYFFE